MLTRLTVIALLATTLPAFAEFPRQGVEGIENGIAAPFAGTWRMGFPEDDAGTDLTEIIGCADPIAIKALANSRIRYASPNMPDGTAAEIDLTSFMDRTVWLPSETGPSFLTIWLSPDAFHLHNVDEMGAADWTGPFRYTRCP